MHIWTEMPEREIWRQLRYFSSSANTLRILTGQVKSGRKTAWSNSNEMRSRAYEIAACIRQADEYQQAAENVSLATSPLLQFYGMQALVKAAILANNLSVKLCNLNYHGLGTRASVAANPLQNILRNYNNNPSTWKVELEYGVVNDGIFPHLCKIAQDHVPTKGEVLRFKDLMRVIPDMAEIYSRHYGEDSHCFYLYREPKLDKEGKLEVFFSSEVELDAVRRVFPEFDNRFEEVVESRIFPGFRSLQTMSDIPDFILVKKGTVAGRYLVRPHPIGIHSSAAILFAGLFILSNLVRYKPAFWMRIIDGEESGSISVVESFCNLAKRRLPNDLLELLWGEEFTYGTPGYAT